jgi:hypothetical protein
MNIDKKRLLRIHKLLSKPILQNIGMTACIFFGVLTISYIAGPASSYRPPSNVPMAIATMQHAISQAFLFTFLLLVPAYLSLVLVYKGRIMKFISDRDIPPHIQLGWGLYLFLVGSLAIAIGFGWMYEWYANPKLIEWGFQHTNWYVYAIFILLTMLSLAGVAYVSNSVARSRKIERLERREAIQKQKATERQLVFIRRGIHPHFLFNTLANLQVLAKMKSDGLPDLIAELSNLLRHIIYHTDYKVVPLEQEIEFIQNYVNLRRLSLNDQTDLRLNIQGDISQPAKIAPMTLLLFVENCFKHFNKHDVNECFIHINIEITKTHLKLDTRNSFEELLQDIGDTADKGFGHRAAIAQLEGVYQNNYTLHAKAEKNVYHVALTIPLLTSETATYQSLSRI